MSIFEGLNVVRMRLMIREIQTYEEN